MPGTNNLTFENFFSTTLSSTITASDTVIYLNALPSGSEGYLVIEPDSTTNKEIIYYTSKGVNFVTCPSVADGRGVGGTTAQSHSSGATVQMNTTAEMLEDIQGGSSNTGMHQYFDDSFADYIKSGGAITQATGLIASVTSGVAYINGRRLPFNGMSKTLTASKDTYFDLVETDGSNIATISYTELSSGATGSAPVSNGVHLGMVRSNASVLATIYQTGFDILGNPLKQTQPSSLTSAGINWSPAGGGDIWWQELGRTTLTAAGDTISVSVSAKKYLRVMISIIPSGQINSYLRFNGDTGNNYAEHFLTNMAGGSDITSASSLNLETSTSTVPVFATLDIVNIATQEKLVFMQANSASAAGAATAPDGSYGTGKWANTSSPITAISITNSGTGDFGVDTQIVVLGHD